MIFLSLFWEFFKIGLFTIGGGYAMLPLIMQVVGDMGWMEQQTFINFVGVAESTPGPFAINIATFVGMQTGYETFGIWGGILGAICATLGVVLPSLVIIMAIFSVIVRFENSKLVKGFLYGAKPCAMGLILSAFITVFLSAVAPDVNLTFGQQSSWEGFSWISLGLVAFFVTLSQIKIKKKKIHPLMLIALSAVIGILLFGVFQL
ncbi:MAG: chromate transporter [Clostridia bacterium]|nr:chromate transporter [Clostridia bacterium]